LSICVLAGVLTELLAGVLTGATLSLPPWDSGLQATSKQKKASSNDRATIRELFLGVWSMKASILFSKGKTPNFNAQAVRRRFLGTVCANFQLFGIMIS
jgi:hypothetical protein